MKNINKIIENEHKIVNKKDLYGLAKKRRANKKKLWKFSSAELEAFERDYWIRYNSCLLYTSPSPRD